MSTEKEPHVYVGIDPGAKGAIAVIMPDDETPYIWDMPTIEELMSGKSCISTLNGLRIPAHDYYKVGIEQVHPLPGQSCTASFTYGENNMLAKVIGLCYNRGPVMIPPQRWKKYFSLKRAEGESKTEFKRRSVDLARKLYPSITDTLKYSKDGRAEALLMAHYLKELDNAVEAC